MKKSKFIMLLFTGIVILSACSKGQTETAEDETISAEVSISEITEEIITKADINTEKNIGKEVQDMIKEYAPKEAVSIIPDVDYGTMEHATYYSTTAERDTGVNVLLPAGYSDNEKYPVLYVLHGYWGNEYSMANDNITKTIVGNLTASGEITKMIVVFPYIYTSKEQKEVTAMDGPNSLNYDNFINDLVTDLMPFIEEKYSIATGKENTAITGFSMGGRESLFIGFSRPDLFGYVGAVCPAPGLTPGTDLSFHPGQFKEDELTFTDKNNSAFLVMISAAMNDNVVGNSPEQYHNILNRNNDEHVWHVISTGDHGNKSIEPHIYNFVKAIFN